MPADVALKAMNAVHRSILALSRGKVGWRAGGMPVLELITIGRRSGQRRAVMLTSPIQEGEQWIVVASRGGDDRHPEWYLNVCANAAVEVRVGGGQIRAMKARVAAPEERSRLWAAVVSAYPHYGRYQTKTEREIPLVIISS